MPRTALAIAVAVVVALLALGAAPGHAEPRGAVALLPLDAGPRLEIYGQAVATEIARALVAGGVEVVVVGAKMDVPAGARLIVDGTLAADKRGSVALAMRVRDPANGTVLETLSASAPGLAEVDRAAAELSARVLPVVRDRLAAIAAAAAAAAAAPARPREPDLAPRPPPRFPPPPGPPLPRPLLLGIAAAPAGEPLRAALTAAATRTTRAARLEPRLVDARTLITGAAPGMVAQANAHRAVAFDLLGYTRTARGDVPLARARVRVRIADASTVLFDRVVVTDTIVGDRRMPEDLLAARVADEVLAILVPHLRRTAAPWP